MGRRLGKRNSPPEQPPTEHEERPRGQLGSPRPSEPLRLRRLRASLDLTQRELAARFGVANSAIAQWESGTHPVPGPVLKLLELYEAELHSSDLTSRPSWWVESVRNGSV